MAKRKSEIFRLSDEYSEKMAKDDYLGATENNIHDYDHMLNDYSFAESDPLLRIARAYKKKINAEEPIDYYDEIAKKVILKELDVHIEIASDIWHYTDWGSVYSDPDAIYLVFDKMPKETKEDISKIIKRLEKVPTAINEWASSIFKAAEYGYFNAKLRVEYVIDMLQNICSNSRFSKFAQSIDPNNKRLMKAALQADTAYRMLVGYLKEYRDEVATEGFHVEKEKYIQLVRHYTGLTVDPREVYEWGIKELDRINAEMWEVGKRIDDKATKLTDFSKALNNDSKYKIHGKENFKNFLENITNTAIKDLNGVIFDIPKTARNCRVELDEDTIDESPYYLGPSDDLVRPAKTSYPTLGKDVFSTWENYSTWFHESVPGHHMQIVTAILNKNTLTRFQRNDAWNSGYGEGWALYSEKLMDELGYFEDPGYKMGYLLCQAMRAARLIVDVGLHLQYTAPSGKFWGIDEAVKLMEERALLNHDYAVSEVKRYISWAGQAISYKLGERIWIESREDAKEKFGPTFNLRKFHMYALKLGPMGLDILKEELAKWDGK